MDRRQVSLQVTYCGKLNTTLDALKPPSLRRLLVCDRMSVQLGPRTKLGITFIARKLFLVRMCSLVGCQVRLAKELPGTLVALESPFPVVYKEV